MERRFTSARHFGETPSPIFGDGAVVQHGLYPVRVKNRLAMCPNGADIAFAAYGYDDNLYYCKDDRLGRPVRLIEGFVTQLASHLGIATAQFTEIELIEGADTYFGSRHHASTAQDHRKHRLLATSQTDELGRPDEWLGCTRMGVA